MSRGKRSVREREGARGSGREREGGQTGETAEAEGSTWHTLFWNRMLYCASTAWTTRYSTYQRMRKGITEWTSVRSWRTVQERMREQWVRDNDLPLTRYGKCTERATHLFPYPWSFQVLTVLADEESGVKQWSICEWRRRRSLSMGKACLGCGDRYKHDLLRVRLIWSENRSSEVAVRCLSQGWIFILKWIFLHHPG